MFRVQKHFQQDLHSNIFKLILGHCLLGFSEKEVFTF